MIDMAWSRGNPVKQWVGETNPLGPPSNPATATTLDGLSLTREFQNAKDYADAAAAAADPGDRIDVVRDFGALCDGSDETAKLVGALNAASPGDTVLIPTLNVAGTLGIQAGTITLPEGVRLCGHHRPNWWSSTSRGATLKVLGGAGTAVALANRGCAVEGLAIDGNSVAGTIHGLVVAAGGDEANIEHVEIFNFTGNGFKTAKGADYAQELTGFNITVRDSTLANFNFSGLTDAMLMRLRSVGGTTDGFRFSDLSNIDFMFPSAEWSGGHGFFVTDADNNVDTCRWFMPYTDSNKYHGFYCEHTAAKSVNRIISPYFRRDGYNAGADPTGLGYSGLQLGINGGGSSAAQWRVTDLETQVWKNEDGSGYNRPERGVTINNVDNRTLIEGELWGYVSALVDGGYSTYRVSPDSTFVTGAYGALKQYAGRQVPRSISGNPYVIAGYDLLAGKLEYSTVGGTVIINSNANSPSPIGSEADIVMTGAGQFTVAGTAGVTIQAPSGKVKCAAQYSTVHFRKRATDTWVLSGDLA